MNRDEELLNRAIDAMKSEGPDSDAVAQSAARVADRLGIAPEEIDAAGKFLQASSPGEALRSKSGHAAVDWSRPGAVRSPKAVRPPFWSLPAFRWSVAFSCALLVTAFAVYRMYWVVPPGVRAEVQSIDGSASLISGASVRDLRPGAVLAEGEVLRTAGGSRAVLRLSDGSTVEMNERSQLNVGARGRNMTVSLDSGDVIVEAAKRTSGHLYVRTPDCRVAVTGTVFSVDAGMKGSRVGVLQGAVDVEQSGLETVVNAGDQIETGSRISPEPLADQVSWSRDRDKYLRLVAAIGTLGNRIGQIPFPQARYSSDLLARVPADTLLYVSVPNLGDFLTQANSILHDQLSRSPELAQWWARGRGNNNAELDDMVAKLHDVSQYLGDEVVIVGFHRGDDRGFAILADVQRSGLDDVLRTHFSSNESGANNARLTVLDEHSLAAISEASNSTHAAYALVRGHEAVFSPSIATLRQVDAQLNSGSTGFAESDFGKQISAAYGRGAGIILAADLHSIVNERDAQPRFARHGNDMIEDSGFKGVRYLIAEHRELSGGAENHLSLQFSGARERVASWLAAPAPIGSLDFVSPGAAFVTAGLTKDPREIAEDLVALSERRNAMRNSDSDSNENVAEVEQIITGDLVPNLGGDFLVSLDGPVLPTPSWKAVVEVRDPNAIEQALERLTQIFDSQDHDKDFHPLAIESSDVSGQRFYAIRDKSTGATVVQYTFSGGFMILAPSRQLLIQALQIHSSGNSLARSSSFKALLPKEGGENCSAVAYQNLGPVLNPLLSQVSGDTANAIRKLAQDSRPTAICAWGEENRIEAASDSRLFGFDFLTLGSLFDLRNKQTSPSVKE